MKMSETKLDWESPVNGYNYRVNLKNRPEGRAQLILRLVSELDQKVQRVLSRQGIQAIDTIAHVNRFFPNGGIRDEEIDERTRTGAGTMALCFLEARAALDGAKAMYVCSTESSMQSFCRKRGFVSFGKRSAHQVKLLNQPSQETEATSADAIARLLASLQDKEI